MRVGKKPLEFVQKRSRHGSRRVAGATPPPTEQGMVATWERSDRAPCALVGRAPSEGRGDGRISNRVSR